MYKRQIQTTPQTFFTGKELAERFYVCERTLSNQLKKVYGKTLYAYQMDVKLEMVRQFLLSQPEVKLHETALNFGFCDEFHLSRTLRKNMGCPPADTGKSAWIRLHFFQQLYQVIEGMDYRQGLYRMFPILRVGSPSVD